MNINHQTKKTALIGYPLTHSISPIMHNKAFEMLGLNYVYMPIETEPSRFKKILEALVILGFVGFNVTIPYKERIVDYCDWLSEDARDIGAVNTVHVVEGKLKGYNTDWTGFIQSLKRKGFTPEGKHCVVIGAGGAARGVVYALSRYNAAGITVINRSREKALQLVKHFKGISIDAVSLEDQNTVEICRKAQLLVNCTPVGMAPYSDKSLLSPEHFTPSQMVYDLIYNPPVTQFLKYGSRAGAVTVNGLDMLILQGAFAFKIWTGMEFPVESIRKMIFQAGI